MVNQLKIDPTCLPLADRHRQALESGSLLACLCNPELWQVRLQSKIDRALAHNGLLDVGQQYARAVVAR